MKGKRKREKKEGAEVDGERGRAGWRILAGHQIRRHHGAMDRPGGVEGGCLPRTNQKIARELRINLTFWKAILIWGGRGQEDNAALHRTGPRSGGC
jgi:hypothetical protein